MDQQEQPWTSAESRGAADGLYRELLAAGRWRDSSHLLGGELEDGRGGVLGGVLDVLQPRLEK